MAKLSQQSEIWEKLVPFIIAKCIVVLYNVNKVREYFINTNSCLNIIKVRCNERGDSVRFPFEYRDRSWRVLHPIENVPLEWSFVLLRNNAVSLSSYLFPDNVFSTIGKPSSLVPSFSIAEKSLPNICRFVNPFDIKFLFIRLKIWLFLCNYTLGTFGKFFEINFKYSMIKTWKCENWSKMCPAQISKKLNLPKFLIFLFY